MTTSTADDAGSVDYYALFEVSPDADTATIRQAVDAFTLRWQKRCGSRKRDVRHEAETRLEQGLEGERVLLDPERRAAYDRERVQRPPSAPRPSSASAHGSSEGEAGSARAGSESLVRAVEAYEAGDHKAARFFAVRATEQSDTPEAWYVLFAACDALGDGDGAEIAGTTALRLCPDRPEWTNAVARHFALNGDPRRAVALHEQALKIDTTPQSGLMLARVHSALGEPSPMLTTMRGLHESFPEDPAVCDLLAQALRHRAISVPELSTASEYAITSHNEVARMRALVQEGLKLPYTSAATRRSLREVSAVLDQAEEKCFTFRLFESEGLSWTCWVLALTVLPLGLVLLFNGLGFGFVLVLIGATGAWNAATRANPRGFELNDRLRDEKEIAMRQRESLRRRMT